MAIRYRENRASPWQMYYNNPFTGKRETASFATRQEAEKEESLIKHRLRFDRDSFRPEEKEETEGQETREMTLEQAYFLYLKEKQFSKMSLKWQLDAMRLPLSLYEGEPIAAIGQAEVREVAARLDAMPVKQVTRHSRLSVLRAVLNWCAEKGFCPAIRFPKMARGHYEKFVPPTPLELQAMLAVAPPHVQRVIILGSQCGIRVGASELFKLMWRDVDLDLALIRVQAAHKNPSAPWREIPIRQSLLAVMREWQAADAAEGVDFVISYAGKPIASIKRAWTNTLKLAGITRRVRPYDLRHAFATELIAQGVDIGTIAKLMGHSSPTMIFQHYQFVMDKQKKSAVEALPDLLNVPKQMCPKRKEVTDLQ